MDKADELYRLGGIEHALKDPESAHMVVDGAKILNMRSVAGLEIDAEELEDGVKAKIRVAKGAVIGKPVHLCFGITQEKQVQRIITDIETGEGSEITFIAHCIFPNAVDVKHIMDARIRVGKNARYNYIEKHIHAEHGGIEVYPKTKVELLEGARFKTEFELLQGRVGRMDIDYETTCHKNSVMEMTARVSAREDDMVKISETGNLVGEYARGVLTSRVAVRDKAKAEVYNKLTASAAYARGHVDCKEIIQDEGVATAFPMVQVSHPKAHVTHEASIGSVDAKQMQTLMARGLTEEEAVDLIIEGLLS